MELASLLIVHRNRLFRESLSIALGYHISHIMCFGAVSELDPYKSETSPDVVILDVGLLECEGARVAGHVRSLYPDAKLIVLGVREEESEILACFEQVRADAYSLENASLDELLNSLRAVMMGEVYCSPRATAFLVSRISNRGAEATRIGCDEKVSSLTPREVEIVRLIDAGLNNKEIAKRLFIEVQTVKNHVHNILNKLKVHDRREAALYSREQGMKHQSA
jgi:two-component system, NarL family, nitrate/nitrite response regulator NarL